jgi:hypothetical protein
MSSKPLAFVLLALATITAAAGGAYVATRHNSSDADRAAVSAGPATVPAVSSAPPRPPQRRSRSPRPKPLSRR